MKSDFTTVNEGVPQGTLFGPIYFKHHKNDLQTSCGHVKYVDGCTLWETCSPSGHGSSLQKNSNRSRVMDDDQQNGIQLQQDEESTHLFQEICLKRASYFIMLLNQAGVECYDFVKIDPTLVRSLVEYACQVWHKS